MKKKDSVTEKAKDIMRNIPKRPHMEIKVGQVWELVSQVADPDNRRLVVISGFLECLPSALVVIPVGLFRDDDLSSACALSAACNVPPQVLSQAKCIGELSREALWLVKKQGEVHTSVLLPNIVTCIDPGRAMVEQAKEVSCG